MKIGAITMVYRDYWALSQWYAHYSRALGSENLFIVSHGADEKVAELCKGATVITVPRDDLTGFDRRRGAMLNSFQDGLGIAYDWIIRTDADELICLDPASYGSFAELFAAHDTDNALFALGLNVVEAEGDAELMEGQGVFHERWHAAFTGHYSKAWAVRRGTHMLRHGIAVPSAKMPGARFTLPRGVYLAHLKYANVEALGDMNVERVKLAKRPGKGLPGKAWSDAERVATKFFEGFAGLEHRDWDTARNMAYDAIATDPLRDADRGILRARSINFDFRTELPEWFKQS